jgi:uncharacterized beta-barrel protein YwiB (DUF1934 family)
MGKMNYKELVMIKVDNNWQYIMNISKTINLNIEFVEQATNFLNLEYSNINFDIDITDKEIYILTENQLPCENCN